MVPTSADVAELVEACTVATFATVPAIVRLMLACGFTLAEAHAMLDQAARFGAIELRPESGMGLLSEADAALCPSGPRGSILSYARAL
jgi:hypothetical protein